MLETILHCAGTFVLWWPPDHEQSTDAFFCSCHHAHTALLFQVSSHLSRRRLVTIRIDDPFACISQICTPPAPNIAAHTASSPANVVAVAAAIVRPLCPMVCCITRAYLAEHATMTTRDSNEKSEGADRVARDVRHMATSGDLHTHTRTIFDMTCSRVSTDTLHLAQCSRSYRRSSRSECGWPHCRSRRAR